MHISTFPTGVAYGVVIVSLAFAAENLGAIFEASYVVTGPSAGVMAASFIMGLFMPFITKQVSLKFIFYQ
jgi:hypothetical protein